MKRITSIFIALLAVPASLLAQAAADPATPGFFENYAKELTIGLMIFGAIILVFGFLMVWQQIVAIHRELHKNEHYQKDLKSDSFPSWFYLDFSELNKKLTDAVPVEKEEDIMLDHNYDGIRELNNHLPPWWKMLFYGTIVFGVVYFIHFEMLGTGKTQYEEYEAEMQKAEEELAARMELVANSVNETNVEALTDEASITAGRAIFEMNCVACHGEVAQGTNVAPNLTDQYWIHGGDIKDVFTTIKYGVETKMIPWGDQLKPQEIKQVASFVMSLQGSNPPNAKEPEGDLYIPEGAEAEVNAEPADTGSVVENDTAMIEASAEQAEDVIAEN